MRLNPGAEFGGITEWRSLAIAIINSAERQRKIMYYSCSERFLNELTHNPSSTIVTTNTTTRYTLTSNLKISIEFSSRCTMGRKRPAVRVSGT